jgi:predicted Zn-dependent protease
MKRALAFALLVAAAAVPATLSNPVPAHAQLNIDFGRLIDTARSVAQATTEIDEKQEVLLGQDWAAVLLGAAPLAADPNLQRYVNTVGRWLASQSERPDLAWHFGVLESGNINAFATPGGYVLVTKGLVMRMRSEAELAGVLAHEIAHVVQKHHLKAIQKGAWAQVGANVATEYLNQRSRSPVGSMAGERLLSGMKEIMLRGLDKDDEFEADRMGVVIAARAGYDPFGLPAVLQLLNTLPQDAALALLFATHPPPNDRLDALERVTGTRLDRYASQPQVAERYARAVVIK